MASNSLSGDGDKEGTRKEKKMYLYNFSKIKDILVIDMCIRLWRHFYHDTKNDKIVIYTISDKIY